MPTLAYLHLDVFTTRPLEGNQLAVFPDPGDLPGEVMQRIATEMAFSETTFILPPGRGGDVRMRIFTPAGELPIAGHPTIGSTFALDALKRIPPGRQDFVFELGVGPTPVELARSSGALSFVWMTQPLPRFGPTIGDRQAIARATHLELDDLEDFPLQIVSCGVPYLLVPLRTRAAVDRADIDRAALLALVREAGVDEPPVFFFTLDDRGRVGDETVYSRMLGPVFGIREDPATGSASGPLGSYLLHHDLVDTSHARRLLSLQGAAMGRPSWIHVSIDSENRAITRVRVGGQAVVVGSGELRL